MRLSFLKNRFGSLIANYKSEFVWWEIVLYSKKVFIFVVPVLMNANISLRILICILTLLIYVIIDQLMKPFKDIIKQQLNLM
jgi:hypothetical protein